MEEILDYRHRGKGIQYSGYPVSDCSWENARYVHVLDLVCQFHQHFPEKPPPTKLPVLCSAPPEGRVEEGVNWPLWTEPGLGVGGGRALTFDGPSTSGLQLPGRGGTF